MFAAGTGAGALRVPQGLLYHRKSYNHPCRAGVMPKITVVGAGNVGATAAQRIAEEGLGEVVMVDGVAGELDTARFRYFIARELNVAGQDVQAILLGGHGDGMVPLPEYTTVNGIPLGQLLSQERIDALVQRTVDGGAEIVKLLKQGSAYYAPSAAIASMARAILRDERKLFCASVLLQGEYGYRDLFLGVPAVLGKGGLRNIIELPLSAAAKGKLKASAASVQENRDKL